MGSSSTLLISVIALLAGTPAGPADTTTVVADPAGRQLVLTLYDQGFGLVTDTRTVRLGGGLTKLEFPGVSPRVQESSVRLGLPGDGAPRLLEQTYRAGTLSPDRLMEAYLGHTVQLHPRDATGVEGAPVDVEILSLEGGGVFRVDGRVTHDLRGRLSFPRVPPELTEPPTLSWLLEGDGGAGRARLGYLTQGLGWSADYVLSLGHEGEDSADLTGWVTLENGTGTAWSDARIELVAGEVRRVSGGGGDRSQVYAMEAARAQAPGVSREELFAYHRYSLDRRVSLPDGAEKRVALLESDRVSVTRRFVVRSSSAIYRDRAGGGDPRVPVAVVLEVENREENGLGIPIPAGVVRVYGAGAGEGVSAFLGEDRIGHTPRDETLRVTTGQAFDLVAERVQTDYEALGRCAAESAWEIRLRNHREEEASIRVLETVSGEWEILSSSHEPMKVDAGTFRYEVTVPARGGDTVQYRVRVNWC